MKWCLNINIISVAVFDIHQFMSILIMLQRWTLRCCISSTVENTFSVVCNVKPISERVLGVRSSRTSIHNIDINAQLALLQILAMMNVSTCMSFCILIIIIVTIIAIIIIIIIIIISIIIFIVMSRYFSNSFTNVDRVIYPTTRRTRV